MKLWSYSSKSRIGPKILQNDRCALFRYGLVCCQDPDLHLCMVTMTVVSFLCSISNEVMHFIFCFLCSCLVLLIYHLMTLSFSVGPLQGLSWLPRLDFSKTKVSGDGLSKIVECLLRFDAKFIFSGSGSSMRKARICGFANRRSSACNCRARHCKASCLPHYPGSDR